MQNVDAVDLGSKLTCNCLQRHLSMLHSLHFCKAMQQMGGPLKQLYKPETQTRIKNFRTVMNGDFVCYSRVMTVRIFCSLTVVNDGKSNPEQTTFRNTTKIDQTMSHRWMSIIFNVALIFGNNYSFNVDNDFGCASSSRRKASTRRWQPFRM